MVEKWYRGHEGNKDATDNYGIIWLSDNPEYAQEYADEYPNGIVSTIFVDMDKIEYIDWYYDEDFDPYDPDISLVNEYMKEQGCNAYTFGLGDGTTVLALLSKGPIVKVERMIVEKKHPKLTETTLRKMIRESIVDTIIKLNEE